MLISILLFHFLPNSYSFCKLFQYHVKISISLFHFLSIFWILVVFWFFPLVTSTSQVGDKKIYVISIDRDSCEKNALFIPKSMFQSTHLGPKTVFFTVLGQYLCFENFQEIFINFSYLPRVMCVDWEEYFISIFRLLGPKFSHFFSFRNEQSPQGLEYTSTLLGRDLLSEESRVFNIFNHFFSYLIHFFSDLLDMIVLPFLPLQFGFSYFPLGTP